MSDYLRRLAERAIGVAQSIKPRAPYRFEAVADSLSEMPHEAPDEVARIDHAERAPDTATRNPPTVRANKLWPPSRSSERSPVDVSPRQPHNCHRYVRRSRYACDKTGEVLADDAATGVGDREYETAGAVGSAAAAKRRLDVERARQEMSAPRRCRSRGREANRHHRCRKDPPRYTHQARPVRQRSRSARPAVASVGAQGLRFKVRRDAADRARERNHAQRNGGPTRRATCRGPALCRSHEPGRAITLDGTQAPRGETAVSNFLGPASVTKYLRHCFRTRRRARYRAQRSRSGVLRHRPTAAMVPPSIFIPIR